MRAVVGLSADSCILRSQFIEAFAWCPPFACLTSIVDDPETEGSASYKMFAQHNLPVPSSIHFLHSLAVAVAILQRTDMVSLFPWPLIELCASRDALCAIPVSERLDDSMVGIIRDEAWTSTPHIRRVMYSVELLI
ncbi:hypothetical protein VSR68_04830 [Paraburkholderia phymatum]|uniref:hypothetical protein n=1 Tax=Paraburkholderia phymatum TaxID=148447 RepID=UPI0031784907